MNGILAHYNVSVQRDGIEKEYAHRAMQEAMKHIKACHAVIKKTHDQNAAPLPQPQAIKIALGEYLDAPENYLDAYKALKETEKYIEENQKDLNIALLKSLFAEYIVEERPIIDETNCTDHE
jgi:hypothetical protein